MMVPAYAVGDFGVEVDVVNLAAAVTYLPYGIPLKSFIGVDAAAHARRFAAGMADDAVVEV